MGFSDLNLILDDLNLFNTQQPMGFMVTFGIPQPLGNLQIIARNGWAALRCPLCHLHGPSRRRGRLSDPSVFCAHFMDVSGSLPFWWYTMLYKPFFFGLHMIALYFEDVFVLQTFRMNTRNLHSGSGW